MPEYLSSTDSVVVAMRRLFVEHNRDVIRQREREEALPEVMDETEAERMVREGDRQGSRSHRVLRRRPPGGGTAAPGLGESRHNLFGEQPNRLLGRIGVDVAEQVPRAEYVVADQLVLLLPGVSPRSPDCPPTRCRCRSKSRRTGRVRGKSACSSARSGVPGSSPRIPCGPYPMRVDPI